MENEKNVEKSSPPTNIVASRTATNCNANAYANYKTVSHLNENTECSLLVSKSDG